MAGGDAVSLWFYRRHGSRKKDNVEKLIEKKHATDEKLANTGF